MLRTFSTLKAVLAIAIAMAINSGNAVATVIYDNFTSADFTVTISDYSYTGVFRSDINQSIGGIGGRISAATDGDLKFVIFDLGNGTTPNNSGPLVYQQQKHFLADAAYNYKVSDPFSFALLAGEWYAVGAIGDPNAGFSISYDNAGTVNPGAGFTAFADANVNFTTFASPNALSGFGCCNIHYQLYDGAAVPEPGSLALLSLALAGLGAVRRRKS